MTEDWQQNTALIHAKDISKTFTSAKGDQVISLENISLDIFRNEFVSIVGPSGCGKSTLLKIIGGLLSPTSGSVEIDGAVVKGAVGNIGFVFQSATLFPWRTVEDNILLPIDVKHLNRAEYSQRAGDLIKFAGLGGFETKFPFELSGGMQQRVSIVRALIHNPKIILMDEPFGALDAITREQMGLELLRIWQAQRITTVFVTHDIAEAIFLSDRVFTMSPRPGKIIRAINIQLPRPREPAMMMEKQFLDYQMEIKSELNLLKN
ncbi:MAG: ABC transporter ATP-binding protein [Thaumarchaeota archaeon]|nr:ABC transporter ATP-binding protein [Nitrososphaerota archaeon]